MQAIFSSDELRHLLHNEFTMPQSSGMVVTINVEKELNSDLSWYRASLLKQTMEKIYLKSGWSVSTEENNASSKILLTLNSVPAKDFEHLSWKRVVVGVVRNIATKQKEKTISVDEFVRMRVEDISSNEKSQALAKATIDFEMLHVGISSCVNLKFDPPPISNRGSNNRGIIFCLYNYARISTILQKFDDRVASGVYSPLQELDCATLDLLRDMKPELQLIRCCLQTYPAILKVVAPEGQRLPQPHLLCRFLSDISHPISRYYRTYHVLTEPSAHLEPTMQVRIHILKAVQRVLDSIFQLIGVEPKSSM